MTVLLIFQVFAPIIAGSSEVEPPSPRLAESIGLLAVDPDGNPHGPFTIARSHARASGDKSSATAQDVGTPVASAAWLTARAFSNAPAGTSAAQTQVTGIALLGGSIRVAQLTSQVSFSPSGAYTFGASGIQGLAIGSLTIGDIRSSSEMTLADGTVVRILEKIEDLAGGCVRLIGLHAITPDGWDVKAGDSLACRGPEASLPVGRTSAIGQAGVTDLRAPDLHERSLGPDSRLDGQGDGDSAATTTFHLPNGGVMDGVFNERRSIVGSDAYAWASGHVDRLVIPGIVELLGPAGGSVYAHANRTGAESSVSYTHAQLSILGQEVVATPGQKIEVEVPHPEDPTVSVGYVRVNEAYANNGVDPLNGDNVAQAFFALVHINLDPEAFDPAVGLGAFDLRVGFAYAEARSPGRPDLRLSALASPPVARAGTPVTFTYDVSNLGVGAVYDPELVDSRAGLVESCLLPTLHWQQAVTCGLTRIVDDMDDGGVPASVTGVDPEGEPVEAHDTAPLRIIHPSLGLALEHDPPKAHSGDTVNLRYSLTNTGDSPLNGLTVTDDVGGDVGGVPSLAPGETFDLSAPVVVSETELRRARALGFDETGLPVTADAETLIPVIHPGIAIGVDATPIVRAGDTVVVRYTVENIGDTPLDGVSVEDAASGVDSTIGTLGPGERADLDATLAAPDATFTLLPTARGADGLGLVVEAAAEREVRVIHSSLGLVLSADPPVIREGGEVVWRYVATNLGDNTLSGVAVSDRAVGGIAAGVELLAGESLAWLRTDEVTGTATAVADASGLDESGQYVAADASAVVRVIHPALAVVATASPTSAHLGEEVTLSIRVTNVGDSVVGSISVSDDAFGAAGTIGSLEPGESANLGVAGLEDSDGRHAVDAAGLDELGLPTVASTVAAVEMLAPEVTLNVEALPAIVRAGDAFSVTYTATNTGNTALHNVIVHDERSGSEASVDGIAPGASASFTWSSVAGPGSFTVSGRAGAFDKTGFLVRAFAADEVRVIHPGLDLALLVEPATSRDGAEVTWTYLVTNFGDSALHDVSVSDQAAGTIASGVTLAIGETRSWQRIEHLTDSASRTASALALDESGQPVADADGAVARFIHPAVEVAVSAEPSTVHEGDAVTLTVVVVNTGDSLLHDIILEDSGFGLAGVIDFLAPGESAAVHVQGRQGAHGEHLVNADALDELDLPVSGSGADTVVIIHPVIETAVAVEPSIARSGDPVALTYTVSNAGDIALDGVRLTDAATGLDWDVGLLAPGDQVSRTFDVAAPETSVVLSPSATGTDPTGLVVGDSVEAGLRVVHSGLVLEATASPSMVRGPGTVVWTFTLVNSGDNVISGVTITDPALGTIASGLDLAAGESATFTVEEAVEEDSIVSASANGIDESLQEVDAYDSASVDVIHPAIEIVAIPSAGAVRAGEEIIITYTATNIGDTTLNDVVVVDPVIGIVGTVLTLAPGESATFAAAFPAEADVSATVDATATDGLGGSTADSASYAIDVQKPALAVDKRASAASVLPGASVAYEFTVTNAGDTGLADIRIDDDHLGHVGTIAGLGPGESATIAVDAALTQTTRNNVLVTAPDGTGGFVSGSDSESVTVENPIPYNLGAPTSQWLSTGAPPASLAPGEASEVTFVATNPSGSTSRVYGLVVGIASDSPDSVSADPDAAAYMRLAKADGGVLFEGIVESMTGGAPFARFDATGLKEAAVTTYRLPSHVFLEAGGRLEATLVIRGGAELGSASLVVFWPSSEDASGGTSARSMDAVSDFTNMFPARGGWYPLHNSFDAWDATGGHAWKQYSWTARPTSDAFAKVEFVVENR